MSENNVVNLFTRLHDSQEAKLKELTEIKTLKSGGGGGTFDGMEPRVRALEDDMKRLLQDTAEIKGMLRSAPSAVAFGELKGRVDSLPTTAKMAAIISLAVGVLTLLTRWHDIVIFFS
ncbi:hypothetical protein GGQ73_000603 [Rhizobium skierniewicense]|uniref:Uncharacterized protein n=1 Tax=Rhizobium skierniewicense TaxID=984260 RepID=A0A7W6C2U3_9HYPH|nr:hypothetical protein [Rhizobium skierniewicense]MBB3944678.1 hypothetical protein [Rhizobium skierniewicense]